MTKINVTRSSMPDYDEYCREIREIWDSRWLTNMGVKHEELESRLKEYLGAKNVTLFTNGHLALEFILSAYDFPRGGEVITTPFTFASTTHAIVRCGLQPVFCDVNDEDFTIDVNKIEGLVTDKTVAILPVHVYGNMCDTDKIDEIAKKYGLKVIYDAAHAFGVKKRGVSSANFGSASMFSFHATKVFNTIEGGAVCYSDDKLKTKLNDLKNFGIHSTGSVPYVGGNAKMNEFCAAMGICNLRHLEEEISKRKRVVERYRERLSAYKLSKVQADVTPNYAYFPVVFGSQEEREDVFARLQANDVVARKYFYPLTNSFECYEGSEGFDVRLTPVAESIASRVLTLPLYADLSLDDVDRICDVILGK